MNQLVDQPDDAVATEIAARFGLGRPVELSGPHARGFQAEVWRLQTETGAWAVRRSFEPIAEADVAEGVRFQEAALSAGVATPAVRRTTEGSVVADVHFGTLRVDEWVDLADPDTALDPVDVGAMVALLHNVDSTPVDPVDEDGWYLQAIGAERWNQLRGELLAAEAPFVGALTFQLDEFVIMDSLVDTPSVMQRCHRDLWADNVRRGLNGRVWVIDWQDCGAADPSFELAALLFEYAYAGGRRARAMHNAYRDNGGPGSIGSPRHFSMAIAQLGHILEISCQRWLDAQSADERTSNEGRVAEFIDKPLSRQVIDGILHGIGAGGT